MLKKADLVAFVPTTNPKRALPFYKDVLGLQLLSEDDFALVFNANGTPIRVVNVSNVQDFKPYPFTVLGWSVPEIEKSVRDLSARGVAFQRYDGMKQDDLGIWQSPSGARIAWFADPEGNILSISQH